MCERVNIILQFFITNHDLLYIYFKRFFLNLKGLSDGKFVSLTKKEYGSALHFLWILKKSWRSISDSWFNAICWSSLLLGILMMKKWVEFSLTSFGTLKYDCVINTIEMFSFLPLVNDSDYWIKLFIMNHISNHIFKNY